eukprot:TRINITY_DN847_c0_g1_i11.p1 TRINITY_DN847_c0_g1~~TRINITY_DN847_c0_g1_i11.p1  ORF type:complete len:655 (+),score=141.07 TRINITY_DN847_c0_g1_i11:1790-3754(+)
MPEQEFEIYLTVLSRLLRLSPAQKAAISDELRDHLEQRLGDLMQTGVSREEAIRLAMEEFGDVTGLALDLTRVSRTPVKTLVVRSTVAASVAAVGIVFWVSLFAPEHRIAAPSTVQAQQDKPAAKPVDNAPHAAVQDNAVSALLNDAELFPAFLSKQVEADFVDMPLSEICDVLQETQGIPMMPHQSAFNDEGIAFNEQKITLHIKSLTFEELLNHLTRPHGLVWEVDDGIVRLTTPDRVQLVPRHFPLHPLIARGHSVNSLLDVVRLATTGWEEENGVSASALVGETVIVRQPFQTQRLIARMLAAIESRQPLTRLANCSGRDQLEAALRKVTDVDFSNTPLSEALAFLSDAHTVPILVDKQALEDNGIAPEIPVNLVLKGRSLSKVLDLLLEDLGLTYVIRENAISVTGQPNAEEQLTWVVYNIKDLAPTEDLQKQLSDAILRSTSGKWMEIDQEGGVLFATDADGCLLVKQTDRVHTGIESLLGQLRRQGIGNVVNGDKPSRRSKLVTKSYRMSSEIAADLCKSLPSLVEPEQWNVVDGEVRTIHLVASAPQLDQVDGVVSGGALEVQVLNPLKDSSKKPGAADRETSTKSVVVRPRSVLIIRQTPQVHREIENFLAKLNIASDSAPLDLRDRAIYGGGGGVMGGGGGGFF